MAAGYGSLPPPLKKVDTGPNVLNKSDEEIAEQLQECLDRIFGAIEWNFSFTVADPAVDGCPLIACSTGFADLCGYTVQEILGRNCRFMLNQVPSGLIDEVSRRHVREFCQAVADAKPFRIPEAERPDWMPPSNSADDVLSMQTNARKDGTLFHNMFYMKSLRLGSDLGDERLYIVALQSEMEKGRQSLAKIAENLDLIERKLSLITKELASCYFVQSSMCRRPEYKTTVFSGDGPDGGLHAVFDCAEVKPWDEGQFRFIKVVAEAPRNRGVVHLVHDQSTGRELCVKRMPNDWVLSSPEEFIRERPKETEQPWSDIGCTRFLNSLKFKYAVELAGVYRDDAFTYVVTSFATEGDLFSYSLLDQAPGPKREALMSPIVIGLYDALRHLHVQKIVHRDISLENVLLSKDTSGQLVVKLIDYCSASSKRFFRQSRRGKVGYQAPEMHNKEADYDAFLTDAFAAGVTTYALLLADYPFESTRAGKCKSFEYIEKNGFKKFCMKRKVRGGEKRVAESITESLFQLLDGLLQLDPALRLTLGENQFNGRKSVFDGTWISAHMSTLNIESPR